MPAEVHLGYVIEDDLRTEALRMALHVHHKPRALESLGTAGPVVHVRRSGELASGFKARQHRRLKPARAA